MKFLTRKEIESLNLTQLLISVLINILAIIENIHPTLICEIIFKITESSIANNILVDIEKNIVNI